MKNNMKKFKLKNSNVEARKNDSISYNVYHNNKKIGVAIKSRIEDDPDNWIEQPEKDYEILEVEDETNEIRSVKRLSDEKVFSVDEVYDSRKIESFKEVDNTISVHYDDGTWHYLRSVCKPEKDYEILSTNISGGIRSVKRLSDGEVFSVGDEVIHETHSYLPYLRGRIYKIEECKGKIKIWYGGNQWGWVAHLKKCTPVLTSEDGVELFEGDRGLFINRHDTKCRIHTCKIGKNRATDLIYFSTREAAEDYRLNNAQKISVQDMVDMFGLSSSCNDVFRMQELVKSRLK